MITIISRWEKYQMEPSLEWSMWRQLGGAFGIDRFIFTPEISSVTSSKVTQCHAMEEALSLASGELIFLEPSAKKNLSELPKLNDFTLILSDTSQNNAKFCTPENSYRICTPNKTDLFGINAASIALSYLCGAV
jgi:hypothetical protein